MSTALTLPLPRTAASIGRRWVAVHIVAQLICIGMASATYGIAKLIGATDPSAGALLKNVAFGLAIATEVVYALAFALMRGAVLRQVLPRLPMVLWVVAVLGYLMLFHLMSGFSDAGSAAAPVARAAVQWSGAMVLTSLAMVSIMGVVMGLIVGTIEALVLRRVAHGAAFWAIWMAIAWSAGMMLVMSVGIVMLSMPDLSPMATLAIGVATKVGIGLIMGLLTLPALKQLEPRMIAPAKIA